MVNPQNSTTNQNDFLGIKKVFGKNVYYYTQLPLFEEQLAEVTH